MDEEIKNNILRQTDWEKAKELTVGLKYLDNDVIKHLTELASKYGAADDNYYIRNNN